MPKEMMPGHFMLPPFKYPEGEYERIFGGKAEQAEATPVTSGNRIEVHCNECPERKACGGVISRLLYGGQLCTQYMREAGNG